ncbi:hypothetical protein HQ496_11095 [bacterium]|nr:hypothetical protein [bacterium]
MKPAIAPGSVQLTVTIGDCNARENNVKSAIFDCEATVQSVQEYGAGTTQLPESTPIRISFRASLLAENADSILQSGNELSLVIQSTRNTNETNTDPIWDTVLIIE